MKMDSLSTPRISYHMIDCAKKQTTYQFHKKKFHISKSLACKYRKNITVEHNIKRMHITNFIWYIYMVFITEVFFEVAIESWPE